MEQILTDIYTSLDSPAAYTGVERVYRAAKERLPAITRENVRDFLSAQRTYTLYHQAQRRFRRLKTRPAGLNSDWQADLAVLDRLKDYNDGHVYVLVVVDVLSRKMYAEPVKRKSSDHMMRAFDAIFARAGTKPWCLYTDSGVEFESRRMQQYWKANGIVKLTSSPERRLHATVAERAIRTIKERMYKIFSDKNTLRWADFLQDLMTAVNHSVCRVTGMRPVDVNEANAIPLQQRLYPHDHSERKARFAVGDTVRVQLHKITFAKGLNTHSDKIFKVTAVYWNRDPVVYRLEDGLGRPLKGYFYERELVKCPPVGETTMRVQEILRQRIRDGRVEYLVRWMGHEREFDSWAPADEFDVYEAAMGSSDEEEDDDD